MKLGMLSLSTTSAVERRRVLTGIAKGRVGALSEPCLSLLRILSSLRLAWQHRRDTQIYLRAISHLFTTIPSAWELSRNFLDAGGVQLVIEILSEQPSREALTLLTTSCRRFGRVVKEHICECDDGVLVNVLLAHVELLDTAAELLVELHVGNPKHVHSVRATTNRLLDMENAAEIRLAGASVVCALVSRDSPFYVHEVVLGYASATSVRSFTLALGCEHRNERYKSLVILRSLLDFGETAHAVIMQTFVELLFDANVQKPEKMQPAHFLRTEALTTAKRLACSVLLHLVRSTSGETRMTRLVHLVVRFRLDRVLLRTLAEIKVRGAYDVSTELVGSVVELLAALYELDSDQGKIQLAIRRAFDKLEVLSMLVWNPEGFRDAFVRDEIPTINGRIAEDDDDDDDEQERRHSSSSVFLTECETGPREGSVSLSVDQKGDENEDDDGPSVDTQEHDPIASTLEVRSMGSKMSLRRSSDKVLERLRRQHRYRAEFRVEARTLANLLLPESPWTQRPKSPVCGRKPRASTSPRMKIRVATPSPKPPPPASRPHRQHLRHKGKGERDHGIIGIIAPDYDLQ